MKFLTYSSILLLIALCQVCDKTQAIADDGQEDMQTNLPSVTQDSQTTRTPAPSSSAAPPTQVKPNSSSKKKASKLAAGVACPAGCICEDKPKKLTCTGEKFKDFSFLTDSSGWVSIDIQSGLIDNADLNQLLAFKETLERLDLSKNSIKSFSPPPNNKKDNASPHFPKLKSLILRDNELPSVGKLSSWRLTALETLDISQNPLLELGQYEFNNTRNLQNLHLQDLKLKSIHEMSFFPLNQLRLLNMTGTKLDNHLGDKQFVGNQKLETVDLTDNGLIEVPFALRSTSSITKLILNSNSMTSLRQSDFINRTKLGDLEIRRCSRLSKIDDLTFGDLTSLKRLIVTDNPALVSISKDAFKSDNQTAAKHELDIIDIRNNNLTTMSNPLEFSSVTFKQVLLSGNPWHCDCSLEWFNEFTPQARPLAHCKTPTKYAHIEIGEFLSTIDCEIVESTFRTIAVTGFILFLFILTVLVFVQKSDMCRRYFWRDQYGTIYYTKASFPPEPAI